MIFTSIMLNVPWFPECDLDAFPEVSLALDDPDGLLAIGANLSVKTLMTAYRSGVFPWYDETQPILWWSPSVRAVIPTDSVYISKNMAKLIRQQRYRVSVDNAFTDVVNACRARERTWITDDILQSYIALHNAGIAHSVEVYNHEDKLVGGLYGVFVRNCFCGESMFSAESNTSKLALISLAKFLQKYQCQWIDCQMPTSHLMSMGAKAVSRAEFIEYLMKMKDNRQLLNERWIVLWQHC